MTENFPPARSGTQSIERAIEIVRVVAQIQQSGANLSRIARITGLNITTTLRMLRSLAESRMLRYDSGTQNYSIGPLAFELGLAAPREEQLQTDWRETIDLIARQTGLTTYLVARSGNEGVSLVCVEGAAAVRAVPEKVGQRFPLGVGCASLTILAALDDDEINRILTDRQRALANLPGGATSPESIWSQVHQTRTLGYALTQNLTLRGVSGVAVSAPPGAAITQLAITTAAVSSDFDPAEAPKLAELMLAAIRLRYRRTGNTDVRV